MAFELPTFEIPKQAFSQSYDFSSFLNINTGSFPLEVVVVILITSVVATMLYKSKKRIIPTEGESMQPTIPNPGLVEADQNYYNHFQPEIGHIVGIAFNPSWAQDYINTAIFYIEKNIKRKMEAKEKDNLSDDIYNNSLLTGHAILEKKIKAVPFNKIEFRNGYLCIDGSNMHYRHNFFDFEQEHILRLTNRGVVPKDYYLILSDNADVKGGFLVDSRVFGLVHLNQLVERTTKLFKKTDKGEIKIDKYFS